jgi:hypothetical protein
MKFAVALLLTPRLPSLMLVVAAVLAVTHTGEARTIRNAGRTFHVESRAGVRIYLETTISATDRDWHADRIESALQELFSGAPRLVPILRSFPTWVRNRTQASSNSPGLAAGIFDSNVETFGVNLFHPSVIGSSETFYRAMVIHEYAHGFHLRCLKSPQDTRIQDALQNARSSGLYRNVQDEHGGNVPVAYALTDKLEYFAEAFTAYLNANDTYPFLRAELLSYDPEGHALISQFLNLNLPRQYQPDLLFWNGRGYEGRNRYEPRPRRQKNLSSNSCSAKKACLRLENDGAHSFTKLRASGTSARNKRSLTFKLIVKGHTDNITAAIRTGRATTDIGEGFSRNFNIQRKPNRKTNGKQISLSVTASSEFYSSRSDSYRVTFPALN